MDTVSKVLLSMSDPVVREMVKAKALNAEAVGIAMLAVAGVFFALAVVFFIWACCEDRTEPSDYFTAFGAICVVICACFVGFGTYYYVGHDAIAVRGVANHLSGLDREGQRYFGTW